MKRVNRVKKPQIDVKIILSILAGSLESTGIPGSRSQLEIRGPGVGWIYGFPESAGTPGSRSELISGFMQSFLVSGVTRNNGFPNSPQVP